MSFSVISTIAIRGSITLRSGAQDDAFIVSRNFRWLKQPVLARANDQRKHAEAE